MTALIILAVIAITMVVLLNFFTEKKNTLQSFLNICYCLAIIGIGYLMGRTKFDPNEPGVVYTSKPTITYEVTNTVVDGEVVKSDTLYIVRIKREE